MQSQHRMEESAEVNRTGGVNLNHALDWRLPEPVLEHRIRTRAYEIFQQRGSTHGHALEDWLKAEREVLAAVCAQPLKLSNS